MSDVSHLRKDGAPATSPDRVLRYKVTSRLPLLSWSFEPIRAEMRSLSTQGLEGVNCGASIDDFAAFVRAQFGQPLAPLVQRFGREPRPFCYLGDYSQR